ncbi:hypothetical protein G3O08_20195 [Cryomorpha ignava]|uniref:Uncharacterized protein n=1 Tax=Cryomorpha ignava TaxID=101383 RepID=A0A7K3WWA4_9FLAO|nr:hypothetical protein [Cryomorpha ignava]NEN25814.1 hypothetical protein [Cryomorpha ignava]
MKYLLLIPLIFTFSSCSGQNKCEDIPKKMENYFPENFFQTSPEIGKDDEGRLQFKIVVNHKSWNNVFYFSMVSRIHHLLDSLNCLDVRQRLTEGGIRYYVYNGLVSKENEWNTVVSGSARSIDNWQFPRYRELNDILINSDPLQINAYDQILSNYHLVFEDPKYDITFSDLYDGIVQNRMLMNDDFEILDSLIQNARMNSAVVDTNLIKEIRRLTPAVGYGFQEDLKIIELPIDEK